MARPRKYAIELLDRGARVVIESGRPIAQVGRDLGIPAETLRRHVRQVEADEGLRPDLPTAAEREEIKQLRRENFELGRANEILKSASVFSRPSSTQTGRSERVHRRAPRALRCCPCRSAGPWACRRPPTTTVRLAPAACGPRRQRRRQTRWIQLVVATP